MSSTAEIAVATAPPTNTRTRKRSRVRPLVAGAATLAYSATLIGAPASRADDTVLTAGSASCPDVQVVFARGAREPPGAGRVGDPFADSLRSLVSDKSIAVYAVQYPASYDFPRAIDGVNDATAFIENTAQACPQTKLVLGGYSQGPLSSTCSPQPVGRSSVSQVPYRTQSQTTSLRWLCLATRRTVSVNR